MHLAYILAILLSGIVFAENNSSGAPPAQMQAAKPTATLPMVRPKKPAPPPPAPPPSKLKPLTALDPSLMDRTVDPCVDFYQYSCGGWLKQNPVPADRASYGRDTELEERNELILRDILEQAAIPNSKRSPGEQKIGDTTPPATRRPRSKTKGSFRSDRNWRALQLCGPKPSWLRSWPTCT